MVRENLIEKSKKRPPTPLPIKRQLRQESGFGCCKCGKSIIEYHHIIPYTEDEPHFRHEDMMCLCPYCHFEATDGAMREDEQRRYKENPFNIQSGYTKGLLKINQEDLVISTGSNLFIGNGDFIRVDNENLFLIRISEDGYLQISVKIFDDQNNKLIEIVDNEWLSGDPFTWDIEAYHQKIIIRKKLRKILLDINAKKYPIKIKAELWYKKVHFKLDNNAIAIDGIISRTIKFSNLCFVAGFIDINLEKGWALNGNTVIVEPDINKKIQKGIDIWKKKKIWWNSRSSDLIKDLRYYEFKNIHIIGVDKVP